MSIKRMELPDGWYPKDKKGCERDIKNYLESYSHKKLDGNWIGGVVPHAGWFYSGKLACQTISLLSQNKNPDVVVVFGGHLRPTAKVTYYDYDQFETPFGNLERHDKLFNVVLDCIQEFSIPDTAVDNTVEIQLPFIKYFFPKSKILAFRSPPSNYAVDLGKFIATEGKKLDLDLLFVGSTDLTHYGPNYGFMPEGTGEKALQWVKETNDKEFIHYLEKMEGELAIKHSVRHQSACSAGGAVSCMVGSEVFGKTSGTIIDYYTSYDVMKNSSFVGYLGMLY